MFDGLRALFVVGGQYLGLTKSTPVQILIRSAISITETPDPELTLKAQMLLSMPFTRMYATPLSAGPILVSHFNDLQSEGKEGTMHSGAPASNVEVMLKGEDVERVETGGDPVGQVIPRSDYPKEPMLMATTTLPLL